MKNKTYIIGAILVLTSLTTLYAQPVFHELKVVAENITGISDREIYGWFGHSVSISGNYAIVGYPGKDEPVVDGGGTGAAYIFERKDPYSPWEFKLKIVAPDRYVNDWFGGSVAISGDYAIVGASSEDHLDIYNNAFLDHAGSAYIFERTSGSSGTWDFKQKIVASDRAALDYFGRGVSISGKYAIVGALGHGPREQFGQGVEFGTGAAYIFEREVSGNWKEVEKLQANDRTEGDLFGISVSISGNSAIVGAQREDEDENRLFTKDAAGSAYIFKRDNPSSPSGTGVWSQEKKIVASDRSIIDFFGTSVAISGDYAIVGAPTQYTQTVNPLLEFAGAAYIFERDLSNLNIWIQTQKITSPIRIKKEAFGYSVAIDGNYAMVGANRHDAGSGNTDNNAGAAYILERNSSINGTLNAWSPFPKIVSSDLALGDHFGVSVAVSGCSALIGARFEDEDVALGNTIDRAGSAYFFKCKEPEKPELCCDIPSVALAFNQYRNTDKFNLNINSRGAGIQEVEVSMIDYHVEYESASCKPKNLGIFGNIRSTTSNFGGLLLSDNNTHSLTWDAGTPTAINGLMEIFISKPELADFRRCKNNTFYFCLKVKITDTDCNICEKIVCGSLKLGPSQFPDGPKK